jgi:hypothetical protein
VEFDDRPGPVRDALASSVNTWHAAMERAILSAREEGHLRADLDEQQMLFEIHGLILALHYSARFLQQPGAIARANAGFDNILKRYGAQVEPPPAPSRVPQKSSTLAHRSIKAPKESS